MGEKQSNRRGNPVTFTSESPHVRRVGTNLDRAAFTKAMGALEREGRHPLNHFGFEKSPTPQQIRALFASVNYFPGSELSTPVANGKESSPNAIFKAEYADFLANPSLTTPMALARTISARHALKGIKLETIVARLNSIAEEQGSPRLADLIVAQIIAYSKIRIAPPIKYDIICKALMDAGKGTLVEWLESTGLNLRIVNEFGATTEEIFAMDAREEQTLTEYIQNALVQFKVEHPSEPSMSLIPAYEYVRQSMPELAWSQFTSCIVRLAKSGTLDFASPLRTQFARLTQQLIDSKYDEIKRAVAQKGHVLDTTIKMIALASIGVDIPTIRWYIGAGVSSNSTVKERIGRLISRGLIPASYLSSEGET